MLPGVIVPEVDAAVVGHEELVALQGRWRRCRWRACRRRSSRRGTAAGRRGTCTPTRYGPSPSSAMQPRLVNGAQSGVAAEGPGAAGDDPAVLRPAWPGRARRGSGSSRRPAGPTQSWAVDLFDNAGAPAGGDPVRRGSHPDGPAAGAVPFGDFGDDVELLSNGELVAAELGRAGDVEDARRHRGRRWSRRSGGRPVRRRGRAPQGRAELTDLLQDRRRAWWAGRRWRASSMARVVSGGAEMLAGGGGTGSVRRHDGQLDVAGVLGAGEDGVASRRRGSSRRRRGPGCRPACTAVCRCGAASPPG